MFKIHGNDIYISRGDFATFDIHPVEDDGSTPHVMDVNEFLRLTVKQPGCRKEVMKVDTAPGTVSFEIGGGTTGKLLPGKYDFDVKLIYPDGSEATIIGPAATFAPHFVVLE